MSATRLRNWNVRFFNENEDRNAMFLVDNLKFRRGRRQEILGLCAAAGNGSLRRRRRAFGRDLDVDVHSTAPILISRAEYL